MITDAERDEAKVQAIEYVRKARAEYKEAKLGDRIDASIPGLPEDKAEEDYAAANRIDGGPISTVAGGTGQVPPTAGPKPTPA